MSERNIDILGIPYHVKEVPVVSKDELRMGEINYLTNEILIDETLTTDMKGLVLMHEIVHAICDLTGNYEIGGNEQAVQSIATALYYVITNNGLF